MKRSQLTELGSEYLAPVYNKWQRHLPRDAYFLVVLFTSDRKKLGKPFEINVGINI